MRDLSTLRGRLSRRPLAFATAVAAALALAVVPAWAITYGEPDGDDHPFVGAMVFEIPERGLFQLCSGTLIDDDVFLTASHCTAGLDELLARFPGSRVLVTFDPTIDEGGSFYTGEWVTHPEFGFSGPGGMSDPHDIAVILLDESPGIDPARLPTAGLLDELKASHVLADTRFTAVGYGTVRESKTKGPQGILDNLDRNRVEQGFNSLTKAWLNLPMTQATGNGGTCYGDSGGPHFVHLNGQETDIVVSVTVTGDASCVATDKTYRVDTASARDFLDDYVDLP